MPFREDLDLSEIVTRFEAFTPGGVVDSRPIGQDVPGWAYTPAPLPGEGDEPGLAGSGPVRCSTRRTVAVPFLPIWDVNRYYRDLGITWPYRPTRRQLREAYVAAGGPDSVRLTHCFKQLLNAEIRAEYDAMPLGEQYLNDEFVQAEIKRRAKLEAMRRSEGRVAVVTPEQVMDEWGLVLRPDDANLPADSGESVDPDHLKRQDVPRHPEVVGAEWQYSFYLWKTTRWDYTRLADWQAALIAELDQQDLSPTLTVGLMGRQPNRYAIAEVAGDWVVFLNVEEEITPDLASAAAAALGRDISARVSRA